MVFYGGSVDHLLRNCLLTGNSATHSGGGVSCELYSAPQITNCTFVDNAADKLGGAVFCDWSSKAAMSNSIFRGNSHRAIGEEDTADVTVQYSLFYANPDGDYGLCDSVSPQRATTLRTGTDLDPSNRTGYPLFVQGPLDKYYLSQIAAGQSADSPAVNAGSGLAVDLGLANLTTATSGDADGGTVDLGFHRVDHRGLAQYTLHARVAAGSGTIAPQRAGIMPGPW